MGQLICKLIQVVIGCRDPLDLSHGAAQRSFITAVMTHYDTQSFLLLTFCLE